MAYPFAIRGAPGDEYIQGTDKLHPLGTLMVTQDARKFRYAKAGELLVAGESLQGPDEEVEVDLTVAAGSDGDQLISITGTGTEAEAFYDLDYLELCCKEQFTIVSSGAEPKLSPQDMVTLTQSQFTGTEDGGAELYFAALKRRLDSEEPDYRN